MLKAYDFRCGKVYGEIINRDHLYHTTLEIYNQHNCYHIRLFKWTNNSSVCDKLAWETCNTLKEALKIYKNLKNKYS